MRSKYEKKQENEILVSSVFEILRLHTSNTMETVATAMLSGDNKIRLDKKSSDKFL